MEENHILTEIINLVKGKHLLFVYFWLGVFILEDSDMEISQNWYAQIVCFLSQNDLDDNLKFFMT